MNQTLKNIARKVRAMTMDVAYLYGVGSLLAGTVARAHPFEVESGRINTTLPPQTFGGVVLASGANNDLKGVAPGDTGITRIYGVAVLPYPTSQVSGGMASSFGVATPPTSGVMDVLRAGVIAVRVAGTVKKDDPAFVWVAASSGNHVQGTFENSASAGNTAAITNARFAGPADANGIAELHVWKN